MSVTFLVVILFILVLVIFILAFREPLAKLNLGISAVSTGSPDVRATGSPASSASPAGNQPRTTAKSLVVDGGSQEPLASPVLPGNAAASPTPTASATATPLPSATPTVPASSGKPTIPSASPSQSTGPKTSPSASPTSSAHPAASPKASPIPAAVRTDATPELK